MKRISLFIVTVYQELFSSLIRILFGPGCRFTPSCSQYAKTAIMKYGVLHGTILSLKRLSRCHPWGGQGYDPL